MQRSTKRERKRKEKVHEKRCPFLTHNDWGGGGRLLKLAGSLKKIKKCNRQIMTKITKILFFFNVFSFFR